MRISWMIPVVAAGLLAAAPASAQIGRKLEVARSEDFWTFFNLRPTGSVDPVSTVEFRPGGGAFASLVAVSVGVDDDGTIRGMELSLSRELVDDPANGVFARDIAKSFLRAAMPADDLPDVEALAREIEHPDGSPGASEGGYAVYLGRADRWERTLEASTIQIRNEPGARGRVLVLTVAARPR